MRITMFVGLLILAIVIMLVIIDIIYILDTNNFTAQGFNDWRRTVIILFLFLSIIVLLPWLARVISLRS